MRAFLIDKLADDVAAASASVLFDLLPEINKLSPSEAFERVATIFGTAIMAYFDAYENWGFPTNPGEN
jgi:hypothetical protein